MVTTTALSTPMLVNQESLVPVEEEDKREVSSSDEGASQKKKLCLGIMSI